MSTTGLEQALAAGRVRAAGTGWAHLTAVAGGAAIGILVALLWSARLVDDSVGFNLTNGILGDGTAQKSISGSGTGIAFALVSGIAGTFTACNVAGMCAIAPLSAGRRRLSDTLKPLAWLALGACTISGLYGAVGALVGTSIPQLSTDTLAGYPVRLLQSTLVFGLIGLAMLTLGLAAAGLIPDPLAHLSNRHPRAQVTLVGGLIGAFLVGRPYPLFFSLFEKAASTHNPAYGTLVFALQSLGNITVMAALYLTLNHAFGHAFPRWLTANPDRPARFSATAFTAAAAFLLSYWVIRVPAHFGIGWWPSMPWK